MLTSITPTPQISVVIPCYRYGHLLAEAVESVVAQSYPHWECIIINDGSPDNTSQVARELAARYPDRRITLIEKPNQGAAAARNAGIAAASGEWIAPLDADDLFDSSYLSQAMSRVHQSPEATVVIPELRCFGAIEGILRFKPWSGDTLLYGNCLPYCSVFKRSLWSPTRSYSPLMPLGAEDWAFWIAARELLVPAYLNQPLVWYRKHANASAADAVAAHHDEINACLRTLNPALYSYHELLIDHLRLGQQSPRIIEAIERIICNFSAAAPHLWRGLRLRAAGMLKEAVTEFERSMDYAEPRDWQPAVCLAMTYAQAGDKARAAELARDALTRVSGEFPLIAVIEGLLGYSTAGHRPDPAL